MKEDEELKKEIVSEVEKEAGADVEDTKVEDGTDFYKKLIRESKTEEDRYKRIRRDVDDARGDIKDTKMILVAALLVLIFMFATVLVMVWLDWKNSNERLSEKLQTMQTQIDTMNIINSYKTTQKYNSLLTN